MKKQPIDLNLPIQTDVSRTSSTVKYLFPLDGGNAVETVIFEFRGMWGICLSSQVGCSLGCRFCMSGINGFQRNLTAAEMIYEIQNAMRLQGVENENLLFLTFQGIGEPLLNLNNVLDAARWVKGYFAPGQLKIFSVSTAGLLNKIYEMAQVVEKEDLGIQLQISLHASDDVTRKRILPSPLVGTISELIQAADDYRRRLPLLPVKFKYSLMANVNDSDEDARRLAQLLQGHDGFSVRVTLINQIETPYPEKLIPPSFERLAAFADILRQANIQLEIEEFSQGVDIFAGCGQLRARF